jgi:hypothetical protein
VHFVFLVFQLSLRVSEPPRLCVKVGPPTVQRGQHPERKPRKLSWSLARFLRSILLHLGQVLRLRRAQFVQHGCEIVRQRSAELDRLAGRRVGQLDPLGVQRLARENDCVVI